MKVEIARHALDRVPLSLIIDDSTVLVNLNYFWMRDRNPVDGQNRRWEDVPVVHPEFFTREFAEFCLEHGVKGKYSVVPCPAALGRIDLGLPVFSRAQQESWLRMCRELITPAFDITPEMITHSFVVDLDTMEPVEPRIWEQYEWETLPEDQEELVFDYISMACQILVNVGLPPEGVTSPGGFGGRTLSFYARVAGDAVRSVTGNPTPYFFKRFSADDPIEMPVWHVNRERKECVGEILATTGDWTGSWTGYGEVDPDKYISADLQSGRLVELINSGNPGILCSHWQGFYGMHNEDRRGFKAFQTVVRRLEELDPDGEKTMWQKCSEITKYACARKMAMITIDGNEAVIDLPIIVPNLTLRIEAPGIKAVLIDDQPLKQVERKQDFLGDTCMIDSDGAWAAFTPKNHTPRVSVIK